jgi:short-subunit dehydrogenase
MYRSRPHDGVAWVTGASSGIGEALVGELVQLGYTVAVTSRNVEELNSLAKMYESRVIVFPGDITDRDQIESIVDEIESHGPIVLAVLNAGGFHPNNGILGDGFRKTIDLNLMGTINCLEPVVQHMSKRGYGHVAVMASVSGYVALPFFGDGYVVSKSALIMLCETIKPKLDAKNIRLQIIVPSFISTTLLSQKVFNMPFVVNTEQAAKKIVNGIQTKGFEICFPKITAYWLKFIGLMPYLLYFPLLRITMFFIRR